MMVNNVILEFPGGLKWEGVRGGGGEWKWKAFNVEGIFPEWTKSWGMDKAKKKKNRPEG